MQAVVVAGGTLELVELPTPKPADGELLVRVRAASLNRADLARRVDGVAGIDAAGEVAAVGDGVAGWQVGDRAMAKVAGGYAGYVAVPARTALPIPEQLTFEQAAASILAVLTEYDALANAGRLRPGEAVVIHAAASGVGMWGVQLAKLLGAGRVLATTRSGRADELLRELGADRIVHTGEEQFADVVLEETGGVGADIVVDHVGGPYLAESLRGLAIGGRIVSVGRLGGAEGTLDLEQLAFKRASVVGTTFRTRSLEDVVQIVDGVRRDVLPALAAGTLRPVVDRVVGLAEALGAQTAMAADEHVGKIVLRLS